LECALGKCENEGKHQHERVSARKATICAKIGRADVQGLLSESSQGLLSESSQGLLSESSDQNGFIFNF
jgi:hypothetical protein